MATRRELRKCFKTIRDMFPELAGVRLLPPPTIFSVFVNRLFGDIEDKEYHAGHMPWNNTIFINRPMLRACNKEQLYTTIAHELGHAYYKHDKNKTLYYLRTPEVEDEADAFAGYVIDKLGMDKQKAASLFGELLEEVTAWDVEYSPSYIRRQNIINGKLKPR